ncbi:sortase [Candidatus Dojkabacteria bacterium]|uniref:Sortase n=1 Tax=Candidatus Dojkabacteria bacterium TaxID=2099670 RepID=A0A955KWK1_9BACT|nr:sortase [Candidatus Dojkabacteria bacterium]MCB9790840.1 sortase [Candidatus Nomurabacteria bacterium]
MALVNFTYSELLSDNQWNIKNSRESHQRVLKVVRVTLSSILAIGGITILISQLFPLGESYLKGWVTKANEANLASPLPGAYKRDIEDEFAYWDPGQSYFNNLISQAEVLTSQTAQYYDPIDKVYKDVVIDESYSKLMSLSITSLKINKVTVTPNVESYNQDIYNSVLKNGLAHFKGTALPGSGGNVFIYGHSAVDSYFSSHQTNPETIFTKLENIEIGDKVEIDKDGKRYEYVVRKKKIVEPDDFSILSHNSRKETLTLMTCFPQGVGTDRLIVTADLGN